MRIMDRTALFFYPERMGHNIDRIMGRLPAGVKTCLVVKADAYGLGVEQVACAMEQRADFFAVATAGEALELRSFGIRKPVLILGAAEPSLYEDLIRAEIRFNVFRSEEAEDLSRTAERLQMPAFAHFKVDTGMNRLGFEPTEDGAERIAAAAALPYLIPEGLFSHFARADEQDLSHAVRQYESFLYIKQLLEERGIRPEICHIANSAAAMVFPEAAEDMVRLGIAIYGLRPSQEMDLPVSLEPAAELKSTVSLVKTVYPGEEVGYGGRFAPETPRRIATVGVGYADGYTRRLSGIGRVLIRGKSAPIVGNICMDQLMADVTDIPETACGDTVTLIGRDGAEEITLEELAEKSGILNYEFQCGLSRRRVPRVIVRSE